jgi:ubiquinone/menaquinone biosynthesis C-methylase UbiE
MNLYDRYILPRLMNLAGGVEACMVQRARIVPAAWGEVLDLGFGSGLNLPFYDRTQVARVWALEPSRQMWRLAQERVAGVPFPVEYLQATAEAIPLANRSVDTVLLTYALCTIPDVARALGEVRRVLKQGGRLLFCEHGAAPEADVRRWQHRLEPAWSRVSGGCRLTLRAPDLIEEGGFEVTDLSMGYVAAWKVGSFHYWGEAVAGDV